MSFELLPHSYFDLSDKGGRLRYALFEPRGKLRGTVLVVPGRREFIEKKYSELRPLLEMGFRLVIYEPRGQGLSSRFLGGDQRQRDHLDSFDTHLRDLRDFFAKVVQPVITDRAPLLAHGHSMGGHIVLRWLAEDRPAVSSAFMTAPMLAIGNVQTHLGYQAAQTFMHGLSWMSGFRHATDYASMLEQQDYGGKDTVFENNPLTQDPKRFPIIENYFTEYPDMKVGGVTWGWMLAAIRSMEKMHSWDYLSRINIPVLSLVGGHDRVTPAAEINRHLNRIDRVRAYTLANARHDLLNEIDPVQSEAWTRIGSFLESVTLAV